MGWEQLRKEVKGWMGKGWGRVGEGLGKRWGRLSEGLGKSG